jgi:hypothetical protein
MDYKIWEKRSIYLSWISLKIQTIVTYIKTKTPTKWQLIYLDSRCSSSACLSSDQPKEKEDKSQIREEYMV